MKRKSLGLEYNQGCYYQNVETYEKQLRKIPVGERQNKYYFRRYRNVDDKVFKKLFEYIPGFPESIFYTFIYIITLKCCFLLIFQTITCHFNCIYKLTKMLTEIQLFSILQIHILYCEHDILHCHNSLYFHNK